MYLYDRYMYFTTYHVKVVQNSRIFKISQIPGFFNLNCHIPGQNSVKFKLLKVSTE